jgi:dipeptidyl-peptidase-3
VKIDPVLHQEILDRYARLNLAPYKGFLNPRLQLVRDELGKIVDVVADYSETYEQQMYRYSHDYSVELP